MSSAFVLYGRDAERAQIGALLEGARASRSGVLVVRGEPGIGKTALLDDVRQSATDMHVLTARGVESESALPFAGLHQLLRPALNRLEDLPRPQSRALRTHLRAAIETFERFDAVVWAERARNELRASGETVRRRGPSAIDQLTPQELQIASFVGDGLSNKDVAAQLFLSPRTVEYHLHKMFYKLGISSRTELARLPLAGAHSASLPAPSLA